MKEIDNFKVRDIDILDEFKATPPNPGKIIRKTIEYNTTGNLPDRIILNEDLVLIDGYISYLIARQQGIEDVSVCIGKIGIVEARHKAEGKIYRWRLPSYLNNMVSIGDKVMVRTGRGIRRAKVEKIVYVDYPDQGRYKKVIGLL